MGKRRLLFLVFLFLMLSVIPVIFAAKTGLVAGIIYSPSLPQAVSGAEVIVSCNNALKSTTSNSFGSYAATYDYCPAGSDVKVIASKGKLYGAKIEKMTDYGLSVNIAVVNIFTSALPAKPAPAVEKEKIKPGKIKITGINIEEYTRNGMLELSVSIQNTGSKKLKGLSIKAIIPELGIRSISSDFDLPSHAKSTRTLFLDIPADTAGAGEYEIEFVISEDNMKKRVFRTITIL